MAYYGDYDPIPYTLSCRCKDEHVKGMKTAFPRVGGYRPCPEHGLQKIVEAGPWPKPKPKPKVHDWEVEYLPDPMSAGGVVRSGALVCSVCGAEKEDR